MKKFSFFLLIVLGFNGVAQKAMLWHKDLDPNYQIEYLAVDGDNDIYIAAKYGSYDSIDVDPGYTEHWVYNTHIHNLYLVKLSQLGQFKWAKTWHSNSSLSIRGVTTDLYDNVLITGGFADTVDLDPGTAVSEFTTIQYSTMFLIKLKSNGDFAWANTYPGHGYNIAFDVVSDLTGNIYLGGYYRDSMSVVNVNNDTLNVYAQGSNLSDAVILKVNPIGVPLWIYEYGGDLGSDFVTEMDVDSKNNLIFGGCWIDTVDFDPGPGVCEWGIPQAMHPCYGKLDSLGNLIFCGALFPGNGGNIIQQIEVNSQDEIIMHGTFEGACEFDPGPDTVILDVGLNHNGRSFILKLTEHGEFMWVRVFGNGWDDPVRDIAISSDDKILAVGNFYDSLDLDPGPDSLYVYTNNGGFSNGTNSFCVELNTDGHFLWGGRTHSSSGWGSFIKCEYDHENRINLIVAASGYTDIDPTIGDHFENFQGGHTHLLQLIEVNGIEEREIAGDEIKIFPNPSNAEFFLQLGNVANKLQLGLFDVSGKLLQSRQYENTSAVTIDMGDYRSGVYILSIDIDGTRHSHKLFKQ